MLTQMKISEHADRKHLVSHSSWQVQSPSLYRVESVWYGQVVTLTICNSSVYVSSLRLARNTYTKEMADSSSGALITYN